MAVYFIRAGNDGPVKIGHATNPRRRMTLLQTGNAERLHLLRVIEGGPAVEAEVHAAFAASRLNGEWFSFSEAMLQYGEEVVAEAPAPRTALHGYLRAERGRLKRLAAALGVRSSAISQWARCLLSGSSASSASPASRGATFAPISTRMRPPDVAP